MTDESIFRCNRCGNASCIIIAGDGADVPEHCPWTGELDCDWNIVSSSKKPE
jgi:hypothetical protein